MKKRVIILVILAMLLTVCSTGFMVNAFADDNDYVNDWYTKTAGTQFVNDAGDGYTYLGTNSSSIACRTGYDVTKPISVDVFAKFSAWGFITLSTSFENAKGVTNEIYDANNPTLGGPANLDKWPFVHMFSAANIWSATDGNLGAMWDQSSRLSAAYLAFTGVDYANKDIPYACDFSQDYYDKCKLLTHNFEIYFGATAEEGYVLVDGQFVARPSATQASFPEGKAYLSIENWSDGHWMVKASQPETVNDMAGAQHLFMFESYGTDETVLLDKAHVTVNFEKPKHAANILAANDVVKFKPVVAEQYKLEAVRACGYMEVEGRWMPAYAQAAIQPLTPDEDGYYTVNTSNWTALVFDLNTSVHRLIVNAENANARITSSETFVNAGDEVKFSATALSVLHEIEKVSYTIGEQETVMELSATGRYTFTVPEDIAKGEPIYINVIGAEKPFGTPTETEIQNSVNGWDINVNGKYGALWSEGVQQIFDLNDGTTGFVLDNTGSISNVNALDVTKPIYIDMIQKYTEEPTVAAPWVFLTMFDRWGVGSYLGCECYGDTGNAKYDIPAKAAGKFQLSWLGSEDVTAICAGSETGAFGDIFDQTVIAGLTNKFGRENWVFGEGTPAQKYATGELTKIEIYFGETAADGYIKIDGDKIGQPHATQADFKEGVCYLHMSYFYTSYVRARLYQEATLDITSEVDDKASVKLAEGYTLDGLKAYDEVKFTIEFAEGYTAKEVSANGVVLTPDENGVYSYRVAFGGASIKVVSGKKITIKFEVNGGSAVDDVLIGNGAKITPPVSTRNGYKLTWCANAELTENFDFGKPVETEAAELTIYAKWTPVEYSIIYYYDINKIRDLKQNSYTIESNITLEAFEKEGYKFEGWYTNPQFTGDPVSEIKAGTTGDITLYAKMSEVQAAKGCGASASASLTVLLSASAAALFVLGKKKQDK